MFRSAKIELRKNHSLSARAAPENKTLKWLVRRRSAFMQDKL